MKTLAALVLGATVLVGCDLSDVTANGIEPIEPEPWYRDAWARVEICTQARRDFDTMSWFRFTSAAMDGKSFTLTGFHNRDRRAIYLRTDHLDNLYTVSHEIIHALVGDREHTRKRLWRACVLHWRSSNPDP